MLVTLWWWLISDVGGRFIMLATFFVILVIFPMYKIGHQHPESVTKISNLSPTHSVSKIRPQYQYNQVSYFWSKSISWRLLILITYRYNYDSFQSFQLWHWDQRWFSHLSSYQIRSVACVSALWCILFPNLPSLKDSLVPRNRRSVLL